MTTLVDSLQVTRIPGDFGPTLLCAGELTVETMEILRRELALLEPLGHPVVILNVNDCRYVDSHGVLTMLTAFKRLRERGQRLIVVAQDGLTARLLHGVGFDHVVPMFSDEETAVLALRGGPPQDTRESWGEARRRTLCYWRLVAEAVKNGPPLETLRLLTSMTPLCQRSDELFRSSAAAPWNRSAGEPSDPASETAPSTRCGFCLLFRSLGGLPENIGCQGLLDPIIAAVQSGARRRASTLVDGVIRTIESLPLPDSEQSAGAPRRPMPYQ